MTTQRIAGRNAPGNRAARAESVVLVAILLVVGLAAGAASFTHVHDWTMTNSPSGTPGWFGWANACISELVPVAALLDIRRRRRAGRPTGYPLGLLVAAAGLSLAAQLAVAKPGVSGGLLSAVPALAFMALVKLVFASAPAPTSATATAAPADGHTTDTARPQVTATLDTPALADHGRAADDTATAAPVAAHDHRPRPTSPRPRRTTTTTTDGMAARVAAIVAERPTVTAEEVAAEIGRAPRTARRYLAAVRADLAGVAA
ncbi:DUF2637 domain-containing protein [Micromonospora globosa]|uniref:DUF2637 domain-containing protein n=1 Tax=Micromonospora globosa TaxID=47863 RepID=UPI000AF9DF47|nr:DUF2637 domain-containing protein [Micromonospora globosa]